MSTNLSIKFKVWSFKFLHTYLGNDIINIQLQITLELKIINKHTIIDLNIRKAFV